MEDFNDYVKNGGEPIDKNLFDLVSSLASKYDGKSQNELLTAIYKEAKRGKQAGTLTNADIDNFVNMLSPFLDDKKRSILNKIAAELKRI